MCSDPSFSLIFNRRCVHKSEEHRANTFQGIIRFGSGRGELGTAEKLATQPGNDAGHIWLCYCGPVSWCEHSSHVCLCMRRERFGPL